MTAAFALLAAAAWAVSEGRVPPAALRAWWPGAQPKSSPVFLDEAQLERIEARAGSRPAGGLISSYRMVKDGREIGRAYLDRRRVRTGFATVLVGVHADGRVAGVEIVEFGEPPEYRGRSAWYRQFDGRRLGRGLRLKRDLAGMSGATMTARTVTDAVRCSLAIDELSPVSDPPEPAP